MSDKKVFNITFQGLLTGHNGWVTTIQSGQTVKDGKIEEVLVSGSRDKTILLWNVFEKPNEGQIGLPKKSLTGHNHFVTDLALSQDSQYLLSSSWDKTLRLWNLATGKTSKRFVSHDREVLTVAFSSDNRQIISSGADRTIKLWNVKAECKYTSEKSNHQDWVTQTRFASNSSANQKLQIPPYFASVGWDGRLKIWSTNFQIRNSFKAHEGQIHTLAISPSTKYIATGGKDKYIYVWDVVDLAQENCKLEANGEVFSLTFDSQNRWLIAGGDFGIKIYDLVSIQDKQVGKPFVHLEPQLKREEDKITQKKLPVCLSIACSADSKRIYGGYTDGLIRVYSVEQSSSN